MDCERFRCKLDLGAKRDLSLDFFFTPGDWSRDCASASPSLSVRALLTEGTIAEAESEKPSFFFPRTLSFSLEMRERGLSCMERSNMLADMLFLINWMSSSTSPRTLSSFPLLSTSLNQLRTTEKMNRSLTQELVEPHLSPVHHDDIQRAAVSVSRVEERQVEGSLFFPHRSDTFLRHGGRKLVLGHLNDGVGVVGAVLALGAQVPSLMHSHLDTRRVPLLALVGQRHSGSPPTSDWTVEEEGVGTSRTEP
ncbi:hypothetical protein FQN60_017823 [Etheostoma spectabile]|uniref:Uncharacterized protein n=1 Tax=Etheostoma spectabile TaxID=54343 RepID=A0A5J5DG93_9PERO|nr:hypothetical protein FQN60_017823 [Etheostoma spectabile]